MTGKSNSFRSRNSTANAALVVAAFFILPIVLYPPGHHPWAGPFFAAAYFVSMLVAETFDKGLLDSAWKVKG